MTKRIVITPRASQYLDENFAYIAQNNLDAALRFFDASRHIKSGSIGIIPLFLLSLCVLCALCG